MIAALYHNFNPNSKLNKPTFSLEKKDKNLYHWELNIYVTYFCKINVFYNKLSCNIENGILKVNNQVSLLKQSKL